MRTRSDSASVAVSPAIERIAAAAMASIKAIPRSARGIGHPRKDVYAIGVPLDGHGAAAGGTVGKEPDHTGPLAHDHGMSLAHRSLARGAETAKGAVLGHQSSFQQRRHGDGRDDRHDDQGHDHLDEREAS